VALASGALVENDIREGRLIRPFPRSVSDATAFCYYLVYPEANAADARVSAFREWVLAEVSMDKAKVEVADVDAGSGE